MIWSRYTRAVLPAIAAAACATGAGPTRGGGDPASPGTPAELTSDVRGAAAETITPEGMRAHVAFLASDELRGRETPSPELERAADYLAERFRSLGLEPAGDTSGWFQRWPLPQTRLAAEEARAGWEAADTAGEWGYGEDFFAFIADRDSVSAEAVFAGALPLDSVPPEVGGRVAVLALPDRFGGQALGALRAAAEAGAVGVVFVLPPALPPAAVGQNARALEDGAVAPLPIPAVGVTAQAGAGLLRALGGEGGEPGGAPGRSDGAGAAPTEPVRVRLVAPVERWDPAPPNVVALLRGSDPELRDTYVVLTAHFDHVGVGPPDASGDSIYNGADDDASGTAVLLEVARAFASLPRPPRRSVLFLAVSGEELGLLGSRHFADAPTVPLEGIVANVNLDMVGRNAPDTVVALGQEFSSLGPLVHAVAAEHPELGLTVAPDPNPAEQAFFRSDHVHFVRKEIPALFLTTWLHEDYHRPSDEVEAIDADKAARVARLVFRLALAVAEDPQPPRWTEDGLARVRELMQRLPF